MVATPRRQPQQGVGEFPLFLGILVQTSVFEQDNEKESPFLPSSHKQLEVGLVPYRLCLQNPQKLRSLKLCKFINLRSGGQQSEMGLPKSKRQQGSSCEASVSLLFPASRGLPVFGGSAPLSSSKPAMVGQVFLTPNYSNTDSPSSLTCDYIG